MSQGFVWHPLNFLDRQIPFMMAQSSHESSRWNGGSKNLDESALALLPQGEKKEPADFLLELEGH